jgi:hypothetical protein
MVPGGMALALLTLAGAAQAQERRDPFAVEIGEEGPDSCRIMVSDTMLSYACGERGGPMTSGVILFPDANSLVILAQPSPWDQAQVAELATRFAAAVDDLRRTVEADPRDLPEEESASRDLVRKGLDGYKRAAQQLAVELAAGKGRDETRPTFQQLHRVRRKLILDAQKWSPPRETMRRIATSASLLAQLDRFYIEARE